MTRKFRVLVVDDSVIIRSVLKYQLARWGYSVMVVGDGAIAVRMIEALEFDLALMDLEMPVMGGLEAAAAVRRLPAERCRELRIIAMSAHNRKSLREICLAWGMNGLLTKPIRREDLEGEATRHQSAAVGAIS